MAIASMHWAARRDAGTAWVLNLYWADRSAGTVHLSLEKGMKAAGIHHSGVASSTTEPDDAAHAQAHPLPRRNSRSGPVGKKTIDWLSEHAKDEVHGDRSRKLVESGIPRRLAALSNYQVILLNEKLEYEIQ